MNIKELSGWLLILGPLAVLLAFAGWPNTPNPYEELIALSKDPSNSLMIMSFFIFGMTALLTGLTLVARDISEKNTQSSSLAAISSVTFPIAIAILIAATGMNIGALSEIKTNLEGAVGIYYVAFYITEAIGIPFGIGFVCLAIPLLTQETSIGQRIIAGLYLLIGIIHLVNVYLESVGFTFIGWLGMFFVSIAYGILILRGK